MIRAVFLDLDGTIVNAAGSVSPANRAIIAELQAAGVAVGLATGRPYFGARSVLEDLAIDGPSLFFSGGLLLAPATGAVIAQEALDSPALLGMIEECKTLGLHFELYSRDAYYTTRHSELVEMHYHYLKVYPEYCELEKVAGECSILKAVIMSVNPEDERKMRSLEHKFPRFTYSYSTGASHAPLLFSNITSPNASRERSLDLLCAHLGISAGEVAAFGDAEADIPFLERAGYGFAMANAPEEVKRRARFVTRSVEDDGVAAALHDLRSQWAAGPGV